MPKIKISYTAPGADVVTANLDGTPVSFSGTAKKGQVEVNVAGGKHRLRYTIEGLPGSSFTIDIETPASQVSITDTIGPTGLAAGAIPFAADLKAVRLGSRKDATKKPAASTKRSATKKATRRSSKKGANQ